MTGSTSPVGRITCSTTSPPLRSSSYGPGVADMHSTCLSRFSNSSNERPVVHRAGQPEAVFDERQLAAVVAGVHAAHLRQA